MPTKSLKRLIDCDGPLLVLDLEATCAEDDTVPKREMEIIEIGAVVIDMTGRAIDSFQAFVQPVRHPQLTRFCQTLTGISQRDVDSAERLPHVTDQFREWIGNNGALLWSSWGRFDRMLFERDFAFHGVPSPLPGKHVNLRECFEETVVSDRVDFATALSRAGLAFEGRPHRGIDDARNTARLVPVILDHIPPELR